MKTMIKKATLVLMLLAVSGWVGSHPSSNGGLGIALLPSNPNVAPNGLPDGPPAVIEYRAGWNASVPKDPLGVHTHYCVMPYIIIIGRKEGSPADRVKAQGQWTQPFNLALVDAKGRQLFGPVTVPTPIPANTKRQLLASPWCGVIQGATKPPEIYLQVDKRRARVIFDAPPRQAETR